MKCLFNSGISCQMNESKFVYCGNCKKVPDMSEKIRPGTNQSMDYLICNAVGSDRQRREQNYNGKPQWLNDEIKQKGIVNIPCMDHTRNIDYLGEHVLISEPYDSNMDEIKNLIGFCEKRNLTFKITGDSVHLPGSTFRIIISKKR